MPNSPQILQSIFDSSNAGIVCINSAGLITAFSPAAERIFGYQAQEVLSRNVSILMPEPDASRHLSYIAEYMRTGDAKVIGHGRAVRGLRKDGTEVLLFLSVGEYEIDGERMFTGIMSDRTSEALDHQRLLESEERFRALASNIDEVFILRTTAPYRYLYISPAVKPVFGLTPEAAMADPELFFSFTHVDDVEFVRKTMHDAASEDGLEVEYRIVRADGETRWVWTRYKQVRVAPGAPQLLAIVVSDITARKQAEEREIEARRDAERANAAKTEFLSRMSHELRTPLNAILGFTQLLELDDVSTEQRASLRQIGTAGRHLLGLINEVLDIARIEAGHLSLSLEPVNVTALAGDAIEMLLPMIQARGLQVTPPSAEASSVYVLADRHRMGQVLLNLLSNAIKYNRDGGQVTVSCEAGPDGMASISVADTGFGFSADELERVFIPFDRLGRENSDIEGSGIGLALTSSLVHAMNGRIEVQSTAGVGSRFSVIIPTADVAGSTAGSATGDDPGGERTSASAPHLRSQLVVVYIEDNPSNLHLMELVAARRPGILLRQAQQGRLGLDLIASTRPGLIMLDLDLPDMSGEELLRRIRMLPETAHTPVVIVSADASPRRVERLTRLGASAYLTKPINIGEILNWFDRLQAQTEEGLT